MTEEATLKPQLALSDSRRVVDVYGNVTSNEIVLIDPIKKIGFEFRQPYSQCEVCVCVCAYVHDNTHSDHLTGGNG